MEIRATMNPADPTRLRNEWRSPMPLGWGLFAMQHDLPTGRVWIADSLGNVHHIETLGPDAYQVAAPLATSAQLPAELYEGQIGLLRRGNFSASPVAFDGLAAFISDEGEAIVVRPGIKADLVSRNTLSARDDEIFRASITPSGGQLFVRSTRRLYCVGQK